MAPPPPFSRGGGDLFPIVPVSVLRGGEGQEEEGEKRGASNGGKEGGAKARMGMKGRKVRRRANSGFTQTEAQMRDSNKKAQLLINCFLKALCEDSRCKLMRSCRRNKKRAYYSRRSGQLLVLHVCPAFPSPLSKILFSESRDSTPSLPF